MKTNKFSIRFKQPMFSGLCAGVLALSITFSAPAVQMLQLVHAFTATPRNPIGGLVQTADGLLYGVSYGGTNMYGAVFKMTTNGILVGSVSLDNSTGMSPSGTLTKGKDGNLYGIANNGGTNSSGTIFKVMTSGPLLVSPFFNFPKSASGNSRAGLCLGADGNFYGIRTPYNDTNNYGFVFKITTNRVFSTLLTFDRTNGAYPSGKLLQCDDGFLYGTTVDGLPSNAGTVYKISTNGLFTNLHVFSYGDGSDPDAGLMRGADGFLYGTTSFGGALNDGTVFRIATNGNLVSLYSFDGTNGNWPYSSLVQGADGNLYGTCLGDIGFGSNFGNIFKVTTNGICSVVTIFNGTNGAGPRSELLRSTDGNFYGTTARGGARDAGTIFKLAPNGTLTTLYSFELDGAGPNSSLLRAADGCLYGVTEYGGSDDYGQVFRISKKGVFSEVTPLDYNHAGYSHGKLASGPDGDIYGTTSYSTFNGVGSVFRFNTNGVLSTVAHFFGTNGSTPYSGLTLASDGNFYGTTRDGGVGAKLGTGYRISTNGAVTTLLNFNGTNGASPYTMLAEGSDGQLYGTTPRGGTYNKGTVFKVTTNGVLTTLVSFGGAVSGEYPGSLLLASNGVFYGTTYDGGSNNVGTIFKFTAGGLVTIHHFSLQKGYAPCEDLMEGPDGHLYGATIYGGDFGLGTVFRMTTNGVVSTLVSLDGSTGAFPVSGITLGSDGHFYGVTSEGGYGVGAVYRVAFVPVITNIVKQAGSVQVSGVGGPINQPYRLLASTNVALPVDLWTPVQTNNFNSAGAFTVTDANASSSKLKFYRIATP